MPGAPCQPAASQYMRISRLSLFDAPHRVRRTPWFDHQMSRGTFLGTPRAFLRGGPARPRESERQSDFRAFYVFASRTQMRTAGTTRAGNNPFGHHFYLHLASGVLRVLRSAYNPCPVAGCPVNIRSSADGLFSTVAEGLAHCQYSV